VSAPSKLASAGQKARIRALIESHGRTLADVLAMAQRYGLGRGDLETLTKVEALRLIEKLLLLREVNANPGRLPKLRDELAEMVSLTLQSAAVDGRVDREHASEIDRLWGEYERERTCLIRKELGKL